MMIKKGDMAKHKNLAWRDNGIVIDLLPDGICRILWTISKNTGMIIDNHHESTLIVTHLYQGEQEEIDQLKARIAELEAEVSLFKDSRSSMVKLHKTIYDRKNTELSATAQHAADLHKRVLELESVLARWFKGVTRIESPLFATNRPDILTVEELQLIHDTEIALGRK